MKLNRTSLLAIAALAAMGMPTSYTLTASQEPKQPKVVTDFDLEQLAKAQAKRDKKAARNLKIGRAM
jgi:hypothetical protein